MRFIDNQRFLDMKYPFKAIFIIILLGVSDVSTASGVDKSIFQYACIDRFIKDIQINDDWDLIGTLEELIDSATTSVDLCIYDLEHQRIGECFSKSKKRGVENSINYRRSQSNGFKRI